MVDCILKYVCLFYFSKCLGNLMIYLKIEKLLFFKYEFQDDSDSSNCMMYVCFNMESLANDILTFTLDGIEIL